MPRPTVSNPWFAALALGACLVLPTGCGYHHIGSPALVPQDRPSPVGGPAHKRPRAFEAPEVASAIFPIVGGASYRYERQVGDRPAGTARLTFGEPSALASGEATITHRLDGHEALTTVGTSGRVRASALALDVELPAAVGVQAIDGFNLQLPLAEGHTWSRTTGGMVWSYLVRPGARVAVPAGEFDCSVVEATGRPATSALHALTVKQTLSFARGVGLVKAVRVVSRPLEQGPSEQTLVESLLDIQ